MRKLLVISVLLIMSMSMVAADNVTITQPEQEEFMNEDGVFDLTFAYEVEVDEERTVALDVFDNSEEEPVLTEIEEGVTGDFQNEVNHTFTVEEFESYTVTVLTQDGEDIVESEQQPLSLVKEIEQNPIEDFDFLNESETIDIPKEEIGEEVPDFLLGMAETIVPEQRVNVEIVGEFEDEFYDELAGTELTDEERNKFRDEFETVLPEDRTTSIALDSELEEVTIHPETIEDSNIDIEVDTDVIVDVVDEDKQVDDIETIGEYIENEDIEYNVSGIRNRIIFGLAEFYVL